MLSLPKPITISSHSLSPITSAPGNHWSLCLYVFACFGYFISMRSYNRWPFVSDFFHLRMFSRFHPCCFYLYSFLWLNNFCVFLVLSGIYPGISFFKSIANLETAISEKVLFLLIGLKIDFFFILSNNKVRRIGRMQCCWWQGEFGGSCQQCQIL